MAGTSDSKTKRNPTVDPLTAADLNQLQLEIDGSDNVMAKIMSTIRKRIGMKVDR